MRLFRALTLLALTWRIMNCPHCKEALKRTKYANANVRECPNCKGMLLATSRAEKIKRRVNKDVEQLMKEVTTIEPNDGMEEIRCPACRDKMDKQLVKHLGIHVDDCNQCGMTWFDPGELAEVQLAFEARAQTSELNGFRDRLENMTDEERSEYEQRIARLRDLVTPMEQAVRGAVFELAYRYYWWSR